MSLSPEELEARHQAVRAFVEQQHPTYLVTQIVEHAKTTYHRPPHGEVYVLATAEDEFEVDAHNMVEKSAIRCRVTLLEYGSLRIRDVQDVGYVP
jgi:hypothetical protein